jgi:lipopolysaccharide biosynthesis glycosyltransferase
MGSRRTCYKIPGTKFCVKCYRSDDEINEGKYEGSVALAPSVVREIIKARFNEKRNTSCQEYRYWKKLKETLPPEVFAAFPQKMECVLVPARGWCLVEERLENFDGSKPEDFKAAYFAADDKIKKSLLSAFLRLIEQFRFYAVRFYDPQNLLVLRTSNDDFVLRIVDFEPASRSFLPLDSMLPSLVRTKTMRRARRWLKMQLGVDLPRVAEPLEKRDPISMSFSVSDNYSQHLAVVLASVLVNNPNSNFVFHVLHRNISDENQMRIRRLEQMYLNCEIKFHLIDASRFEKFPIPKELEHVTQEMYYRYLLPDILENEDRTIYSDVDVLCVGDLRSLWELDLKGNILAAVSEGEAGEFKKKLIGLEGVAPYFNSGVLIMDLEKMRNEGVTSKLMENTVNYAGSIAWPDQDIINITFRNRILELEPIWNAFDVLGREMKRRIVIHHFANASQKPWCNIWKNCSWPLYLKYLRRSSYRENAFRFAWGHIKGFFFFKYTKKQVTRYLVCGIRVWRRKV